MEFRAVPCTQKGGRLRGERHGGPQSNRRIDNSYMHIHVDLDLVGP